MEEWLHNFAFEILVGASILALLLGAYAWLKGFSNCGERPPFSYGYSDFDGPHTWRHQYDIRGQHQSPINIISMCARCVPADQCPCLTFSQEHHTHPAEIRVINDGNNVVLYAIWNAGRKAIVQGGPLPDMFRFCSMRFRWGTYDEEGSEHMIDMRRYAMEMQVIYTKCNIKCVDYKPRRVCSVAIISYLFEVTCAENPYLEPIIHSMQHIRKPCSSSCLRPFPLSLLAPHFKNRYFTYMGSLTYPPFSEGVRWIVQPEPLTISSDQLAKFRELVGYNGLIYSNARTVQPVNNRELYFYE